MIKRDDPDRIIKDCADVIEHLKWSRDLQPEIIKAHYYRGRANHHKGVVDIDEGCFRHAVHDFEQVARNHNADPHIHAMALYYCGVCSGGLGNDEPSKDYFEKALNKFDTIANNPGTDYDMLARALHYCGVCCDKLSQLEQSKPYFYLEQSQSYHERADESGFVNEPQPYDLGAIVQKSEDLKKRVMGKLGITEDSE